MSRADAIQQQIHRAYGTVANDMGREFDVFRSQVLTDPLNETYYIDTKLAAFSLDTKFGKPQSEGLSKWLCWIDGRLNELFDIQQGDHLKSQDTGETYYIASTQVHLPIQAILCNETITISRGGYSDPATGYAPGLIEFATSVPCQIIQPSAGGTNPGFVPGSSYARESVPTYVVYLWDPNQYIKERDIIVVENAAGDGVESEVLNITRSDIGTKLITQVTDPS